MKPFKIYKHGAFVAQFRTMGEAMQFLWRKFEQGQCNEDNHSFAPFTYKRG